jgi:hypothetical protein
LLKIKEKVKVKFTLEQATKAQRGVEVGCSSTLPVALARMHTIQKH